MAERIHGCCRVERTLTVFDTSRYNFTGHFAALVIGDALTDIEMHEDKSHILGKLHVA